MAEAAWWEKYPVISNSRDDAGDEAQAPNWWEQYPLVDVPQDAPATEQSGDDSLGLWDTASALGLAVYDAFTTHAPGGILATWQGTDVLGDYGDSNTAITRSEDLAEKRMRETPDVGTAIPGVTAHDIVNFGVSTGASLPTSAAALGVGGVAALIPFPGTGTGAGFATAYKLAKRASMNQFSRQVIDAANEASLKENGRILTKEELAPRLAELGPIIDKYGTFEGVGEGAEAILRFKIFTAPVAGAIGKIFGNHVLTRIATKVGADIGQSIIGETITQQGQHNAAYETGLLNQEEGPRDWTSPGDILKSGKEVAATTALQSVFTGGLLSAGHKIAGKFGGGKEPEKDRNYEEEIAALDTAARAADAEGNAETAAILRQRHAEVSAEYQAKKPPLQKSAEASQRADETARAAGGDDLDAANARATAATDTLPQAASEHLAAQQAAAQVAPIVPSIIPPAEGQAQTGAPADIWTGRRGDGYETPGAAAVGLARRQAVAPHLDWKIEQMPSGRYQLAGYANTVQQPQVAPPADHLAPQPAQDIVASDGRPFKTAEQAKRAATIRGLTDYSVIPGADGFSIRTALSGIAVRNDQQAGVEVNVSMPQPAQTEGENIVQQREGERHIKGQPAVMPQPAPIIPDVPPAPTPITTTEQAPSAATIQPAITEPVAPDRRKDTATRQRVAKMSRQQMRQALLTDELTGLPNRRAYDETPRKAAQASIDVDSLKFVNDNFGHEAGDALLREVSGALQSAGVEAYRRSGDEFIAQHDDAIALKEALDKAREALKSITLEYTAPDGVVHTYTGPGFSYGTGQDTTAAEIALQSDKAAREAGGQRAARGEKPGGVAQKPPAGGEVAGEEAVKAPDQSAKEKPESDKKTDVGRGAASEPLRYDPATNRHNGQKLVRGDILVDDEGNTYSLDRDQGFMLTLDRLNAQGRPAGIVSYSVDPGDKSRYRALTRTGRNAYEGKPPEAPAKQKPAEAAPPEREFIRGATRKVRVGSGAQIEVYFSVVDVKDLITSHDDAGGENAKYPASVQPRDRTRAFYQAQISKIAGEIDPEQLGEATTATDGAPVVGPDAVVESGNGRTIALRRAYASGNADAYRQWLVENAERFGLTKGDIEAIKSPVLVRVRRTKMDKAQRSEFARQANQPTTAAMSPVEQAKADAARISDEDMALFRPDESGNVLAASNSSFLRQFSKSLGENEVAGMTTSDGRYTKQMADRVRAAVFQKAYGSDRLLTLLAEEASPDQRNIIAALSAAAPSFARARALDEDFGGMDVVKGILSGVDLVFAARQAGQSLEQLLSQQGLFGGHDPVAVLFARFIAGNNRSARRMGEAFTEIGSRLEASLRAGQNADMFGSPKVDVETLLGAVGQYMEKTYGPETGHDLFSSSPGGRVAEGGGQKGEQTQGERAAAENAAVGPGRVREAAKGRDEVAPSIEEREEFQYEREVGDLQDGERAASGVSQPADAGRGGQIDLFIAPDKNKKEAYAGLYGTVVKARPVGTIRAATDEITGPQDAAHLFASIRKSAQEAVYVAVTNKKGKILRIIRHTKGTQTASSVSPITVVAEAASIPGAAKIFIAHNHPSGSPSPSESDRVITQRIVDLLDGTGMVMAQHVVLGRATWAEVEASTEYDIEPRVRRVSIPITERFLTRRDVLSQRITSPSEMVEVASAYQDSLILLNNPHYVVGIVPITPSEMRKLRAGGMVRRIMSAIDKANASAVAIKTDDESSARNMARFLGRIGDVRVLDWINDSGRSDAEKGGHVIKAAGPFFSRTGATNATGRTVAAVEAEIEKKLGKRAFAKLGERAVIVKDTAALREDMQRRGSRHVDAADDTVKGLYDPSTDTSYIVAGNLAANDSAWGVFLHEVGEHYGLERMMGEDAHAKVLSDTTNMLRLGVKPVLEAAKQVNASENVGLDPDAKDFKSRFADKMRGDKRLAREVVAYMAETPANHNLPIMRRIVAAVRAFLRKLGIVQQYSVDDIMRLVTRAARRSGDLAVNGQPMTPAMASAKALGQPLFSRSPPIVATKGERFTLPAETLAQSLRRKLQDAASYFEIAQKAVVKQGGTVDEDSDMVVAIRKYPGRLAAAMKDMNDAMLDPLMKRIHDAGTTPGEVVLLAYAEHASERNREIAKINDRFPNDGTPGNSGSGMTDDDAMDIIKQAAALPNGPKMFALSAELRKITDKNLDNMVAGGVMSQEQADSYRAKYKRYVPLKGFELIDESGVVQGTGKGLSTGKKIGIRAFGRSSRAGQIFENILRDYEMGLMLVEKARVAKTVRNFVRANPDETLWSETKHPSQPYMRGPMYRVFAGDEEVLSTGSRGRAEDIASRLRETDDDVRVEEDKAQVASRATLFDPTEEIQFIEDGKAVRITLNAEGMTRAYNNLWHAGVSDGLALMNSYNGWLRQWYTQKNPAWFVMNVLRDIPSAMTYTTGEVGASIAAKIPLNIPKAFKAAWALHHGKSAGKMDAVLKQYMASGGYTGFAYVGDIEAQTLKLQGTLARYAGWDEALRQFKGGVPKGLRAMAAKAMNTRFFAWIEALNSTFENMTRIAVFKSGIDSGLTVNQAGQLAKHASTNFNTRGEWGPNINAAWLFANAGIQGTRNVGHALLFSPHKEQVWALMGGLAMLGVMAGLMSDDDDDLLDDEFRARALLFKIGDIQISIPMPYGFGFFAGFGQLAAQVMKHPEKRDKMALKMASLAFDHYSPFGSPVSGEGNSEDIVNIAPTIARPILNAAVNVSPWGGSPLYPDSPFDTTKPDSEKMWAATRKTGYAAVAEWTNALTGGDSRQSGAVSVSPETLKLSVNTLFGGAGRLVTDVLSLPSSMAADTVNPKNVPLVKNFYRDVDKDAYVKRFYAQAEEAQDAYRIFRNYQKDRDFDAATAYRNEERAYVTMGRVVTTYRKRIKELRDREATITASDMPNAQKNALLASTGKRIVETTTLFNDRLEALR